MNIDYKVGEVELSYKSTVKHSERMKVRCSKDAYKVLKATYRDGTMEHKEYFKILLLNKGRDVLGYTQISEGGISSTIVDVRVILQIAILCNASSIILAHNHPSGNLKPSKEDEELTTQTIKAAKLMNIQVSDHIILSEEEYYSFSDEGLL
ncbi:JAB domain-containing protein [Bacteroides thetaiotaomicron]|uniref:JAB domain-containing protein n=1 Tax=Bacteroides thetaiotaomicron TaxID=818 RepID=UPI0039C36B7E